jgi:hypothetical protein
MLQRARGSVACVLRNGIRTMSQPKASGKTV